MRVRSSSAERIVRSAAMRAASTNCGSFHSTSAWSGVFVTSRFVVQNSRVGASSVSIVGGGTARFQ